MVRNLNTLPESQSYNWNMAGHSGINLLLLLPNVKQPDSHTSYVAQQCSNQLICAFNSINIYLQAEQCRPIKVVVFQTVPS